RVNGLNAEPGWRWPWVARLKGCLEKSVPPSIARIPPVALSRTTTDELRPTPSVRPPAICCTWFWRLRSSVDWTSSPPPKASPAPYLSTSCWRSQEVKYGALEFSLGISICDDFGTG